MLLKTVRSVMIMIVDLQYQISLGLRNYLQKHGLFTVMSAKDVQTHFSGNLLHLLTF